METTLKERAKAILENIPVSINCHYGDAFQPSQWDNTVYKLKYLKSQDFKGEVGVSSKMIISEEQVNQLYEINPNLWIFCGITGLNEGVGISLEDRFENYLRICEKFKNTVLNIRPLIPGKNDSMEVLKPIIDVVARGRRRLKHGGYLDPTDVERKKWKYESLKAEIKAYCQTIGVYDGPRGASVVSDATGRVNSTFAETDPKNLEVLQALGYDFEITDDNYVKLTGFKGSGWVTKGDVSFAKHIVLSSHVLNNFSDNRISMQLRGPRGQLLNASSSWFHWGRETKECIVNCWYCHVSPGTPCYKNEEDMGCSPIDLYEFMFKE